MVLLAAESLPGGGIIALSGSPGSVLLVTISGPRAAWPAGFAACLLDETAAWETASDRPSRNVQAPLTALLAREHGLPMSMLMPAGAGDAGNQAPAAAAVVRTALNTASRSGGIYRFLRLHRLRWPPARHPAGPARAAMDDDLIADFLTETNESLADLDVALVKLERTPDDKETLSLIFRLVHTIKGTCGFLGLPRLEHVAHAGENVLGKVRDGVLTATPDTVTLVLAGLDRIKAIVDGLAATGTEPAGDDSELVAALDAAAAGQAPTPPPVQAVVAEAEPEPELEPEEPQVLDAPPPGPVVDAQAGADASCAGRRARRTGRRPTRRSGSPWTCWKT